MQLQMFGSCPVLAFLASNTQWLCAFPQSEVIWYFPVTLSETNNETTSVTIN